MRRPSRLCLLLALLLAAGPLAVAQDRLDTPRAIEGTGGFFAPPDRRGGPLAGQGFTPGRPGKLMLLDSWIESNLLPNDVTASLWQTNETLYLVGWVAVPKDRDLVATVQVQSAGNATVFQERLSGPPAVVGVNGFVVELGEYAAGFYQVKFRVKQGKKSVGARFWIEVSPPAPGIAL